MWFLGICLFSAAFDLDEKSLFDTGWKQRLGVSLPVELALQALLLSYEGSRSQVTCLVYDKAQYFSSFFMYLQKSFFSGTGLYKYSYKTESTSGPIVWVWGKSNSTTGHRGCWRKISLL